VVDLAGLAGYRSWQLRRRQTGRPSPGSGSAPRAAIWRAAVHGDGFRPDLVLAIARGGLFVAGALGYALDVKNLHVMNVEYYTGVDERLDMPVVLPTGPRRPVDLTGTRVLVADDVADTGATLALVKEFCRLHVAEVRCAVIYEKPRSVVECEYVWRRNRPVDRFPVVGRSAGHRHQRTATPDRAGAQSRHERIPRNRRGHRSLERHIGAATAVRLAAEGYQVWAGARRTARVLDPRQHPPAHHPGDARRHRSTRAWVRSPANCRPTARTSVCWSTTRAGRSAWIRSSRPTSTTGNACTRPMCWAPFG